MILPIFIIIGISVATALVLDYMKQMDLNFFSFYMLVGLFIVFGLNIFKFIIWNFLHKKYDLSSTYPMTAMYFPIIYIIAIYKNEINIDIVSFLAICFIFGGVYLILKDEKKEDMLV